MGTINANRTKHPLYAKQRSRVNGSDSILYRNLALALALAIALSFGVSVRICTTGMVPDAPWRQKMLRRPRNSEDSRSGCSDAPKDMSLSTGVRPKPRDDGVCAPTTVPVKDDEWGSQHHGILFHRDQIPGLSQQCTDEGYVVRALSAFDGRLHVGYGDYSDNTGPIAMHAWDPVDHQWLYYGTTYTDQVAVFRASPSGKALYTPVVDGHGDELRDETGVYQLKCGSSQWGLMGNAIEGSAHNYDVAFQGETIMVGTGGRRNQPALLMATEDEGETWTEMMRQESSPTTYNRIPNIAATDELIFISGRKSGDPKIPFVYVRYNNEMDFRPIMNLDIVRQHQQHSKFPYLVPIALHDNLIIVANSDEPPKGESVASYRISGTNLVEDKPWPLVMEQETKYVASTLYSDPKRLLVLVKDSHDGYGVFRTDSLKRDPVWEVVLTIEPFDDDDRYVSIAFLNNDLYLGTRNGDIHIIQEVYKPAAQPRVALSKNSETISLEFNNADEATS